MALSKRRKDGSPLDAKLHALHEQQEGLRRRMEEHQRLIDAAPGIAKQQETQRRKELMSRDTRAFTIRTSMAGDMRTGAQGGSRSKPLRRKTRRERDEARIKCVFLIVLVICLAAWLLHAMS